MKKVYSPFSRYDQVPELVTYCVRESGILTPYPIRTPEMARNIWLNNIINCDWWNPEVEHMIAFLLNAKNNLKGIVHVTSGIADACLVHPREMFRSAIAGGACAIIMSHNHPSGDPEPSDDDHRINKQLTVAGDLLDIHCLDHVIIGTNYFYSFCDKDFFIF